MAVTLVKKPDYQGDSSPAAGSGRWAYIARVSGEANPETALLNAVIADTGFFWYNLSLRRVSFTELVANSLYECEVEWEYDHPDGRAQDPTDSPGSTDGPGGTSPSGTPTGPATPSEPVGGNHRFDIGGRPPKLMASRGIEESGSAGGGAAPDHGKLINYSTREGLQGAEVDDPSLVMEVDVKFDRITMNFVNLLYAAVWSKNQDVWYHCDPGCVAFMGGTLAMADDGTWKGSFRFGLRPRRTIEAGELRDDVGSELPAANVDQRGWDYLEVEYAEVTDAALGLTVAKPIAFRIHNMLPDFDFLGLGIGGA